MLELVELENSRFNRFFVAVYIIIIQARNTARVIMLLAFRFSIYNSSNYFGPLTAQKLAA